MFRSIRWRIVITLTALIVVAMSGLGIYLARAIRAYSLDALRARLIGEARLAGEASLSHMQADQLDAFVRQLALDISARITVISSEGVVLADSEVNASGMENHLDRPEIVQAKAQGSGSSIRKSSTLGIDEMYVAVYRTGVSGGGVFFRVALPLSSVSDSLAVINRTIVAGTAVAALVAVLVALWISIPTSLSLKRLTVMSRSIAAGELDQRIDVSSRDEVGELAAAFNVMSGRLNDSVTLLTGERDKLAAILATMGDGIIIVDHDGLVTTLNRAAVKMFGMTEDRAKGHTFIEVVRDHELDEMLQKCRIAGVQQTGVVETSGGRRNLGVTATALGSGFLMLFQDLTEFRRTEMIRRDFVSNISHELRTPIASLKVLLETLQARAMEDPKMGADFLSRALAEADRLAQMVNELAELSRIESGRVPLAKAPVSSMEVIRQVVQRLRPLAERAGLDIAISNGGDLPLVMADAERIGQVLVNIVHNSIKFTPAGGRIAISTRAEGGNLLVSVADTGIGIDPEDLPRVFERFYKADKARGGGGTGLGLAIARHIVQLHGGEIRVESQPGRGSTFTFSLPL